MDIDARLKKFEEEFKKLPTDVQHAIRDLIDEVGLNHTDGCAWRVSQSQFELALPVLQIISPSITGKNGKNESIPTFRVAWNAADFIVPVMNDLEDFSPLAEAESEPVQLCRSTSGDDWCVTPKSDDCRSTSGIPNTRRHQHNVLTPSWPDVDRIQSTGDDWCVTPKSVQAGDHCHEDETPMFADDSCSSSFGGW